MILKMGYLTKDGFYGLSLLQSFTRRWGSQSSSLDGKESVSIFSAILHSWRGKMV